MILVAALLFASGAAALVFEALWFHQAAIALGNDVVAASCVLAAFMGGNAFGGLLAPRLTRLTVQGGTFATRNRRRMLRTYAALELLVGGVGLAIVGALPAMSASLAVVSTSLSDMPLALNALRTSVALLALGLPAVAMGATLPVLLTAIAPSEQSFGRSLGVLYASNTAGAVLGVLGAELLLVPQLGIFSTGLAAACVCGAIALIAALSAQLSPAAPARADVSREDPRERELSREDPRERELSRERAASPEAARASVAAEPDPASLTPLLLAAGLSGFALLGLETVWMRFLSLVLNDTPLAFAIVLAVVLAGIALGGALAALLALRVERIERFASVAAFATGALGIGGYHAYTALIERSFSFDQNAVTVLLVCAPIVLPTCVLSGVLYTLLGARLRTSLRASLGTSFTDQELAKRGSAEARAAGTLAFANTIGAALGALAGGLLLLPNAGMERAFIFLCACYAVIGLLLVPRVEGAAMSRPQVVVHALAGSLLVLAIALFPFGDVRKRFVASSVGRWMGGEDRIASVIEGRTATLIHVQHRQSGLHVFDQIATNAYSMTVDDFMARRYMKLFAYLPTAIHPKIERALVVGYGLGSTARAVLDNAEVKRLDIVDTEPKLLALARSIPPKAGRDPLSDPRAHVHIDDGRHFVQLAAARGDRYDLITGEPPPPILAGVVHLYTREYFAVLRSALRDGGMVSYWLPMMNLSAGSGRAITRAFCQVFDDCSLWHGAAKNFILLGSRTDSSHAARERSEPREREGPAGLAPAGGSTAHVVPVGPVSVERYTRLFRTGALRTELTSIGLEHSPQLAALFIGDAKYLRKLTAYDLALTDDFPRRIARPVDIKTRDAMLWEWRDTKKARERFSKSAFVEQRFPPTMRHDSRRFFEDQRLINDLVFATNNAARQMPVLAQLLEHGQLSFPVLLLLGSDPDVQAAMRKHPPARPTEEHMRHTLAGYLATRNYEEALPLARMLDKTGRSFPGLREYIEQALQRQL